MFAPALVRRNREYWNDPFEMFDDMFPEFRETSPMLEKSFSGFSTDVSLEDGNYVLECEMPGFSREEIGIDLKNDLLTVSAQHTEETGKEGDGRKYLRRERRSTSYSRSFRVENVLPEDIDATYENGILRVKFPKRDALPEQEVKKIEIH